MSRIQQALNKLNSLSAQIDGSNPRPARNFDDLKRNVAYRAAERFDYRRVSAPPPAEMLHDLRKTIGHLCDAENPLLNRLDRDRLIGEVYDEVAGAGPLGPLVRDTEVTELLVQGPMLLLVRRGAGELRPHAAVFHDETHLRNTLERLVTLYGGSGAGSRWEVMLPEGMAVLALVPPAGLGVSPTLVVQRL